MKMVELEKILMLKSAALDMAPDGVQIVNLEGRVVYSNKAIKDIYGFSPEELEGKFVDEMNADPEFAGKVILPAIRESGSWAGELMVKHKRGHIFPIWLTTSLVKDESGVPVAMIGIIRDISERKRVERLQADFYAMITHDMKSPLAAILGFSDLLLSKEDALDPESLDFVGEIKKSGGRLLRMVEDFLTASYIESGNLKLRQAPEDIADTFLEISDEFQVIARNKGLKFKSSVQSGLPAAMVDRRLVQRAMANLVENALKFTPKGGEVSVDLRSGMGRNCIRSVMFSVTDTGPGIPAGEIDKIFTKFYRPVSGESGAGLGLAIVKAVVEAHGGRVEVESSVGRGSTFTIIFPLK